MYIYIWYHIHTIFNIYIYIYIYIYTFIYIHGIYYEFIFSYVTFWTCVESLLGIILTLSRDVEKVLSEVLSPGSIPSQQLLLHLPAEPATRVVVRNCEFCPAGCKENDLTKVGTSFSRIIYISQITCIHLSCARKKGAC